MIYVSITRDSIITNQGQFASMEEAQAWLDLHEGMGTFGQKAQAIEQQVEVQPAVLDGEGNEISPAQFEMQQVHIPGYTVSIEDRSVQEAVEQALQAKVQAGAAARQACQNVLDYIAGENLNHELTIEQITIMQQTFGLAEQALRAGRPTLAKGAIQLIQPDGDLVTQEMKDQALALLSNY